MEQLHILKLCVGAESVEDLEQWQAAQAPQRMQSLLTTYGMGLSPS